jgi:hypothetical protein
LNPKQEALLQRVLAELDQKQFLPANSTELARDLGVPPQASVAILNIGKSEGRIVQAASDLYYSPTQIRLLISHLLRERPSNSFEPAFIRVQTGLSRRLADLLSDCLEREGLLKREVGSWNFTRKAVEFVGGSDPTVADRDAQR